MSAIYDVYAKVCTSNLLTSRLAEGMNASLRMVDTGWLEKTDQVGLPPMVDHEIQVYQLLEEAGLTGCTVPEYDESESYDGVLIMRLINMGAPLFEYARSEYMTKELWMQLCETVGLAIRQFHDEGFVHHDLHDGNIVIEVKDEAWHPVIIDFGYTTHDELTCDHLCRSHWDDDPEADVDKLLEALRRYTEPPEWYEEGLEKLEHVALCPYKILPATERFSGRQYFIGATLCVRLVYVNVFL
jgi:serine/threonine protein kinase